ncbi:MAG: hypothetical protein KA419_10525 [Acidobacteria bacterium]|nr:hypothetical protein [Acidobacteriota bacterium]
MQHAILMLSTAALLIAVAGRPAEGAVSALERKALTALYNSTAGNGWTHKDGWKTPPLHTDGFALPGTEGSWYGVTVTLDRVTKIDLYHNHLVGPIPREIGNLVYMKELQLNVNQLSGALPPEIGNLVQLTDLSIAGNQISGPLPETIWNLFNLKQLSAQNNQLTGGLSSAAGNLASLQSIELCNNQLSGSIPAELGNLVGLERIDLSWNQFSGSIPATLFGIPALKYLYLQRNELTGGIPLQAWNRPSLRTLNLQYNQLAGTLPAEVGNAVGLAVLDLAGNQFSGSLPTELGGITQMTLLSLSDNLFSGTIPPSLGLLTALWTLDLSGNQLTGSIPSSLGNLAGLNHLVLSDNRLSGAIPASLGNIPLLLTLDLGGNQLEGQVPASLGNLGHLSTLNLRNNALAGPLPAGLTALTRLLSCWIGYNMLYTSDPALRDFLAVEAPGWEATQTVPPTELATEPLSPVSARVSWTPILYTGDAGSYRVYGRTNPGGALTLLGSTADKAVDHLDLAGLTPSTTYYLRVQTRTEAHGEQQNVLMSPQSTEVTVRTPDCFAPGITQPPQSPFILAGQGVTLSVGTSGTAPRAYQWYRGGTGDTTHPVGADSSTYATGPLAETALFWVRVTNVCGQADSATATVTVYDATFDVNDDGFLDGLDAQALAQRLAGNLQFLPCGSNCPDLNHDGAVDILDLHLLERAIESL